MSEQDHGSVEHGGEFVRLAEFARHGTALQSPESIRARGTRRAKRRRAGQAALGVGTFAVVAGVGAALALPGSGHGATAAVTSASAKASVHASVTVTTYLLPTDLHDSMGSSVLAVLRTLGFRDVWIHNEPSDVVPANHVIEIVDEQGHSLGGTSVATDTRLTIVVSDGPAA